MHHQRSGVRAVALCLMLSFLLSSCAQKPSSAYEEARQAFALGAWERAELLFSAVPEEGDSQRYLAYLQAVHLSESGQLDEAMAAFSDLGDFLDSREEVQSLQAKIDDRQTEAIDALFLSGSYEAFLKQAEDRDPQQTAYAQGMLYWEQGEYEKARDIFAGLSGFMDSDSRARQAQETLYAMNYQHALDCMGAGDTAQARTYLSDLPQGYRDRERLLRYCTAYDMDPEKNARTRYAMFASLGSLLDAAALAEQAKNVYESQQIQKAQDLAREGFPASATDLMAGISDGEEKCTLAQYLKARSLLEELEAADDAVAEETLETQLLETLDMLGAYLDSETIAQTVRTHRNDRIYQTAVDCMEADPARAAALWESIPGYRETDSYLSYLKARAEEAQGHWGEAAQMYESLHDFLDSEDRAACAQAMFASITYASATDLMEQADFGLARTYFSMVPETGDAQKYLSYLDAFFLEKDGHLEEACAIYASLGAFLDSEARWHILKDTLEAAQYQDAIDSLSEGDVSRASALLSKLGDYADAPKYRTWLQGLAALENGDAEQALQDMEGAEDIPLFRKALRKAWDMRDTALLEDAEACLLRREPDRAEALLSQMHDSGKGQLLEKWVQALRLETDGQYGDALAIYESLSSALPQTGCFQTACQKALSDSQLSQLETALMAGDRENAARIQAAMSYVPYATGVYASAREAENSGDMPGALALYRKIPNYLDSRARAQAVTEAIGNDLRTQAEAAFLEKDWARVLSVLSEYPASLNLDTYGQYMQARALEETCRFSEAALAYAAIRDAFPEADACMERNAAREDAWYLEAGRAALQEGDLEAARDYLYKTNAEEAKDARDYLIACEVLENGYPASAYMLFMDLPDYPGSAEKAAQCLDRIRDERIADFTDAVSTEDWAMAENALNGIPAQRRDKAVSSLACYLASRKQEAAGDIPGAIKALEAAGDVLDSPARMKALQDAWKGMQENAAKGLAEQLSEDSAPESDLVYRALLCMDPEKVREEKQWQEAVAHAETVLGMLEGRQADPEKMIRLLEESKALFAPYVSRETGDLYTRYLEARIHEMEGDDALAAQAYADLQGFRDSDLRYRRLEQTGRIP